MAYELDWMIIPASATPSMLNVLLPCWPALLVNDKFQEFSDLLR